MAKYGVFSGPYFPIFSPNTGKYGLEETSYLNTFHAVPDTHICTTQMRYAVPIMSTTDGTPKTESLMDLLKTWHPN